MNPLQTFYNNEQERKAVEAFLIQCLIDITVDRAFQGRSTEGIEAARTMIDTMFNKLEEAFEPKKPVVIESSR